MARQKETNLDAVRGLGAVLRHQDVGVCVAAALLLGGGSGGSVAAPTLVGRMEPQAATDATNSGVLLKVVERRRADD